MPLALPFPGYILPMGVRVITKLRTYLFTPIPHKLLQSASEFVHVKVCWTIRFPGSMTSVVVVAPMRMTMTMPLVVSVIVSVIMAVRFSYGCI